MALAYANISVEIREISLKEKPASMLKISPKGTVPVFQCGDLVIEQSLDIMKWALQQNDPNDWYGVAVQESVDQLIAQNDEHFKPLLDRYKYPERAFQGMQLSATEALSVAVETFLKPYDKKLENQQFLLGDKETIADIAIFPFVRQFSMVDLAWFDAASFPSLKRWLNHHIELPLFMAVMQKYPTWHDISTEKK
jgi:glutathione S-transferase